MWWAELCGDSVLGSVRPLRGTDSVLVHPPHTRPVFNFFSLDYLRVLFLLQQDIYHGNPHCTKETKLQGSCSRCLSTSSGSSSDPTSSDTPSSRVKETPPTNDARVFQDQRHKSLGRHGGQPLDRQRSQFCSRDRGCLITAHELPLNPFLYSRKFGSQLGEQIP